MWIRTSYKVPRVKTFDCSQSSMMFVMFRPVTFNWFTTKEVKASELDARTPSHSAERATASLQPQTMKHTQAVKAMDMTKLVKAQSAAELSNQNSPARPTVKSVKTAGGSASAQMQRMQVAASKRKALRTEAHIF